MNTFDDFMFKMLFGAFALAFALLILLLLFIVVSENIMVLPLIIGFLILTYILGSLIVKIIGDSK